MTSDLVIRPLAARDRDSWQPLWRAYLRAWLAWQGDAALGLAHAIAHPHGWRVAPVTYLQDLFTVPQARGRGVARALIDAVYADADAAGRPAVYWLTQTGNATARALYDRIATPTDFMVYRRKTN
mgnify:CR=1 FL=1